MDVSERNSWFGREILVHERALRHYLNGILKCSPDIEDVVQDTYARLLNLNDLAFCAVRNWRAFLFSSARNAALDRLRRARVVSLDMLVEIGNAQDLDPTPHADDALNARQELALLLDTIASLPDRCRQVLTLRKLDGLSQREIAKRLGISENTVEKHVAYGVRLCAERMYAKRGESKGNGDKDREPQRRRLLR
jgi:RNA polymerase sigma factor (sigma-70 family)